MRTIRAPKLREQRTRSSLLSQAQRFISRFARAMRSSWEPSRWSIAAIGSEPR